MLIYNGVDNQDTAKERIVIPETEKIRYLGITVDRNLRWDLHIDFWLGNLPTAKILTS